MKKLLLPLLTFVLLLSLSINVFASDNNTVFSEESRITPEGEVIPGLIPLPDDYPLPEEISKSTKAQPDGYYIDGNGVAARRPYGLNAPILGRLYTGDIVWTHGETARADGYTWLHVDTDRNSNMGEVVDVWIVIDYVGEPWSLER